MDDEISRYLSRVATFVDGAYFSVHYKVNIAGKKPVFPGNACQNIKQANKQARYWAVERQTDVYLAMGAQKDHGGYSERGPRIPKAVRQIHNIIACRCLYMDVDVDPSKETAYATVEEMEAGISKFYADTGIPEAPLVILSGRGGKHLYWPLQTLITPEDHLLLSHALVAAARSTGLKFDGQCSVDVCRLLRIPGTYNFKTGARLPVKIERDTFEDYGVDEVVGWLTPWWSNTPTISSSVRSHNDDDDGEDWSDTDSLAAGIDEYEKVSIEAVRTECGFIDNAIKTGGEHHDEPLWKHCISICCHTTDPETNAHLVSALHGGYDHGDTLAKLKQAQRDRELRPTIGPPKCAAIQSSGAKECLTCKYKDSGSNPISLGFKRPLNGHRILGRTSNIDLPSQYFRGKDNRIYLQGRNDSEGTTPPTLVFDYEIKPQSAYLEKGNGHNGYFLNFTSTEASHERLVRLDGNKLSNKISMSEMMNSQGLFSVLGEPCRVFLMSFTRMLQDAEENLIEIPAVGWYMHNGETGFAFNREFITPTRALRCHALPPEASNYGVAGELLPWQEAARIVLHRDRPDLAVLVATAFAAPLVSLAGQQGFMVGCWSEASGIAKTTAIKLAQTVWGAPSGINGLNDTPNHIFAKAATIHSLPLFMDEIKTIPQIANFLSLIFQITFGKEKGRANRDGTMRAAKEWKTMLAYAANISMCSAAEEQQKGTYASLYRMFEFHGLMNTKLEHSISDISRMIDRLDHNYGVVGKAYAKYIGQNYINIVKLIQTIQHDYEKKLQVRQEERYWAAAMTTILAGAYLANKLQFAPFDLATIDSFMVKEFHRMRTDKLTSSVDYSVTSTVIHELSRFLGPLRGRQTVVTNLMWMQAGRPPRNVVKVLNDHPGLDRDHVRVQISNQPQLILRFADSALAEFCAKNSIPKATFAEALKNKLSGRLSSARIGSGTNYANITEFVWTFPVAGTPLENEVEWTTQYFS